MKHNTLVIQVNQPVDEVFAFAITPPNSTKWIPSVVAEETSTWPIRIGTIYRLQDDTGVWSEVIVSAVEPPALVEWKSLDGRYHCRYTLKAVEKSVTELTYDEWVDSGELDEPFTAAILAGLKQAIEA